MTTPIAVAFQRCTIRLVDGVVGPVANKGTTVKTFESMPRPRSADQFAAWLVPARNNIQREMLRLRPILTDPKFDPFPQWVYNARHLVLGACFSLWRSVFQARYEPETVHSSEEARRFLDKIILDNSATFTTELNPWSLACYVENAVYRLLRCREIAIEAGVDGKRLPGTDLFGELGKGTIINIFGFPETFTLVQRVGAVIACCPRPHFGDA